ncbi:hypothetical protein [Acidithiobacillus sp.]|jgi:hypothetical protein|uniref:hypothetical protein n=1 Tax=Acidithiobacillus sp. TaxID=1872118 RepID=UPI0025C066A2|nr:hypothetical protein [Acidithiobacillus sp.]MCK9188592.1 hypothetical protein [Acidithiobacillus sp.]MCK9360508.1 hypothetical protein [Acidithiobacillus sp.]
MASSLLLNFLGSLPAMHFSHPEALIGTVLLPVLLSTGLLLKYWRQVKDQQIILGFLFFAVTMGLFTQYWGITGLHLLTGGFVIWPLLVLILGDRLPWPLAYPLTFIGTLIPDLYGAGMAADWSGGWFFGVGGAGFRDALFLVPLEALIAAVVLNRFGIFMRKRGYFNRRTNVESGVFPHGIDRRTNPKGETRDERQ